MKKKKKKKKQGRRKNHPSDRSLGSRMKKKKKLFFVKGIGSVQRQYKRCTQDPAGFFFPLSGDEKKKMGVKFKSCK
jgi:hypothetical protein